MWWSKAFVLLVGSIWWPVSLLLIRLVREGSVAIEHQIAVTPGTFALDIGTCIAIGFVSAYILTFFIKPKQRLVFNMLPLVGYMLGFIPAIFFTYLMLSIGKLPVIGPMVLAVIPVGVMVIIGYMCGKVWGWATLERSA